MKMMNKIQQTVTGVAECATLKGVMIENVFMRKGEMFGKVRIPNQSAKVDLRHVGNGLWVPRKMSLDDVLDNMRKV